MEVLLDCTDQIARTHVSALIKLIVQRLKVAEADILNKTETITTKDENGVVTSTIEQPASLCARFIMKCLSLLNTHVAKSWSRFDQFLDILLAFGCGEDEKEEDNLIGLEFFMNVRFVERVCDFILGRKSPLCMPSEKRFEMGGSFSQPNFTPLIKMLTKILTNQALLDRYPLTDLEKKMFLDAELLKILLSNQSGGK
jgi:hypothetical protein